MELAPPTACPWARGRRSAFVYAGLPGEPALGPATFMHRFSGMDNPEAPLGHHWLDSTHVTFGVATLGWIRGSVKLEGSVFTGREPDQHRDNIECPEDGLLVRAGLVAAGARLVAPGEPRPSQQPRAARAGGRRRPHHGLGDVQPAARRTATGRPPSPGGGTPAIQGDTTDSFLLESAVTLGERHTLFGRAEQQKNDELIGHGDEVVDVGKLSLGYIWDGVRAGSFRGGVGLLGSVARVPRELELDYGDSRSRGWRS